MANSITHDEILRLIGKLSNDWDRITDQKSSYQRIDLDIFKEDIRKLYELVYALETSEQEAVLDSSIADQGLRIGPEESILEFSLVEKNIQDQYEPEKDIEPVIDEPVTPETLPQMVELTLKKPDVGEPKLTYEKPTVIELPEPHQDQNLFTSQKKDPTFKKTIADSSPDLFSGTKTIADLFHQSEDNSVAARMQSNKISDIKSVIGINDKFLFINQIFKGELTAYNIAINTLNSFETLEDALQFLHTLKAGNLNDENMYAFGKLTEMVKRKYQ